MNFYFTNTVVLTEMRFFTEKGGRKAVFGYLSPDGLVSDASDSRRAPDGDDPKA